jgi:hypothetical protein
MVRSCRKTLDWGNSNSSPGALDRCLKQLQSPAECSGSFILRMPQRLRCHAAVAFLKFSKSRSMFDSHIPGCKIPVAVQVYLLFSSEYMQLIF